MTELQHKMFVKQITNLYIAKYGGYTFTIKCLVKGIYKLVQTYNGATTTLYTGSADECIFAAVEALDMITGR